MEFIDKKNRNIFDLIIVSHIFLFYSAYVCFTHKCSKLIKIFGIYAFIVNMVSVHYHFYYEKQYTLENILAHLLFFFALIINNNNYGIFLALIISFIYYISNLNKDYYESFHFWQHIFGALWIYIIGIS